MKAILRSLACVLFFASSLVLSAKEAELQKLPEEIGSLKFIDRTDYDQPRMGYSLRYEADQKVKADVFAYDDGLKGLKDGVESPEAKQTLANALAAMKHYEKEGRYREVKELKSGVREFKGMKTRFLWSRCSLKREEEKGGGDWRTHISDTYLLVSKGRFVKIRLTVKEADLKEMEKDIDAFVEEVARAVEKELEPAKE